MSQKHIITGILLLDKPQGISSQTAVSKAKNALKSPAHDSKKAGHTGTLDPMATGLLPICFGGATKFAGFGLDADKSYLATIKLGQKTDTGDKDGQVIEKKQVLLFDQAALDSLAHTLLGEHFQIPPMYSALKKDGKKLYEYARDGINIEREARPITIFKINLTKLSDDEIALSVQCSKGTYVRVLGETIAEKLGTVGHLTKLRRTATGGFDVAQAIDLEEFLSMDFEMRLDLLCPADHLVRHLPALAIDKVQGERLRLGQRLNVRAQFDSNLLNLFEKEQNKRVRLIMDGQFLGVGELEKSGRLQPVRLLF